jgi:hypothetical protein
MTQKKRKLRVTPQRKRKPDYRKMSAALEAYLNAQAEADAEAGSRPPKPRRERA